MSLINLIGRKLPVDFRLLKDLHVELARQAQGTALLTVQGAIMESAKVFESLGVITQGHTVFITVYACLPFWNRRGSPDFRATSILRLDPGIYAIRYASTATQSVLIKEIELR